jgi:hypothetical protein
MITYEVTGFGWHKMEFTNEEEAIKEAKKLSEKIKSDNLKLTVFVHKVTKDEIYSISFQNKTNQGNENG